MDVVNAAKMTRVQVGIPCAPCTVIIVFFCGCGGVKWLLLYLFYVSSMQFMVLEILRYFISYILSFNIVNDTVTEKYISILK